MEDTTPVDVAHIVDSLSDGVYVCDPDRKIKYWSKSAERITGWRPEDVVGQHCYDGVLCHIDNELSLAPGDHHGHRQQGLPSATPRQWFTIWSVRRPSNNLPCGTTCLPTTG
ncbi:MAG: PAS domain-containing protein [Planctomycetota bacterium]|jgi:PAS domain-containing protein